MCGADVRLHDKARRGRGRGRWRPGAPQTGQQLADHCVNHRLIKEEINRLAQLHPQRKGNVSQAWQRQLIGNVRRQRRGRAQRLAGLTVPALDRAHRGWPGRAAARGAQTAINWSSPEARQVSATVERLTREKEAADAAGTAGELHGRDVSDSDSEQDVDDAAGTARSGGGDGEGAEEGDWDSDVAYGLPAGSAEGARSAGPARNHRRQS